MLGENEMSGQEWLSQKDQTFVLSLVLTGILIFAITLGALGAYWDKTAMVEWAKEVFSALLPIASASWAWYFKKHTD